MKLYGVVYLPSRMVSTMLAFWEPQVFWALHVYIPLSVDLRCSMVSFRPVPLKVVVSFIWNHVKLVSFEEVKLEQDRVSDVPWTICPGLVTFTDVFTGGSD